VLLQQPRYNVAHWLTPLLRGTGCVRWQALRRDESFMQGVLGAKCAVHHCCVSFALHGNVCSAEKSVKIDVLLMIRLF